MGFRISEWKPGAGKPATSSLVMWSRSQEPVMRADPIAQIADQIADPIAQIGPDLRDS